MHKKRIAGVLTTLAAIPATIFGASGTAWADGGHTWEDAATHRCLDSNAQGQVYTLPCNGGNYQIWDERQDPAGQGLYQLKDRATGMCLYVRATKSMYAYTKACDNSTQESYMWYESQPYDINGIINSWQLKSLETGNVLDSNAQGNVYAMPASTNNWYQHWL
jgi:hypothetical protein